jgi:hypothetical protein
MKFCRYCDGMIVWGTEVCPHCGETLKVTEVDDLDFVTGPAAAAPPKPASSPPPEDDEEEPETIEFESLDIPPETAEMPVMNPMGAAPPVMKPIPARPPVVKPLKGRGGPPVVKPRKAPGGPPVMKPIAPSVAPVLTPIGGGTPPPPPAPVEDCPLCGEPMVLRGGACRSCQTVVCIPCQMRANGMRAGRVMEMNKVRWGDRSKKMGPDRILCPQCGKKGVELV